jgi:hypothetical protein
MKYRRGRNVLAEVLMPDFSVRTSVSLDPLEAIPLISIAGPQPSMMSPIRVEISDF